VLRVERIRALSRCKVEHRARCKVDAQFIGRGVRVLRLIRRFLAERCLTGRVFMLDEQCDGGCHDSRRQLCFCVSAHLFQRGQHRSQQGHAAPLPGTLPLCDAQNVRLSRFGVAGFYPRPCQRHRAVVSQRMPTCYPVRHHRAVPVRFHALHDLEHVMLVYRAGCHYVRAVRAANQISLDQAQPQSIRPVRMFVELHHRKHIAVHQETGERQRLQPPEVIHASSIAKGAVRPKFKFAGDLRLQSVCLFLVQVQIVRVHLRGRHKAAAHHVGAQGLDGTRCQRDAHISIPAPFAQNIKIIFDILFCAAAANVPAAHSAGNAACSVVSVAGAVVHDGQCGACHSAAIPFFRADCRNGFIQNICHVVHRPYTSCGEKW